MTYNTDDIKRDVRIAMDENSDSRQLVGSSDVDTLMLDDIIESKITDAVKSVETTAPVHMLDPGYNFADAIRWKEDGSGWIILPNDFMRLIVFKMSDWERKVYTAIAENDPKYNLQSSRWKGLRGSPEKPVCAIVMRAEGMVLEFYSCKNDEATVEHAVYLPSPTIENGFVEISERCYRAVVYYIAGLVSQTLGSNDSAKLFFEVSESLTT